MPRRCWAPPSPTPLYALYKARFGFSELIITVIFATYAGGVIVALLGFGGLSDVALSLPVIGEGVLTQAWSLKPAELVFAAVAALAAGVLVLLARRRLLEGG